MHNYCEECETPCSLCNAVNFCIDCIHYDTCDILVECDDLHSIECDNGFEEDYDEYDDCDEVNK